MMTSQELTVCHIHQYCTLYECYSSPSLTDLYNSSLESSLQHCKLCSLSTTSQSFSVALPALGSKLTESSAIVANRSVATCLSSRDGQVFRSFSATSVAQEPTGSIVFFIVSFPVHSSLCCSETNKTAN